MPSLTIEYKAEGRAIAALADDRGLEARKEVVTPISETDIHEIQWVLHRHLEELQARTRAWNAPVPIDSYL